ncbi:hypothetical protein [Rubripirellula obstinata]|nr:hypothetical protein [Rubripirellula obstinata]
MMFVDCRNHSSIDSRWTSLHCLRWLLMLMLIFGSWATTQADETDSSAKLNKTAQLDMDEEEDEDQDEDLDEDEDSEDDEDLEDDEDEEDEEEEEEDGILGSQATESLPTVSGGRFNIPMIAAVSTATSDVGNGSTPDGFRTDAPRPLAPLPELASERRSIGQDSGYDASWTWSVGRWAAANTFSNPRYFEDVMLERHGHQRWGHLQPVASGIRFFTTIPMLPYKMAIKPPCECEYTMGYYRTGSCAPALYQRPPWDRKAILAESAAVATGMILIP